MTVYDPATLADYEAKYKENSRMTGFGLDEFRQHWPCPFCAEADFAETSILNLMDVMTKAVKCGSCGRESRWSMRGDPTGIHVGLIFVSGPEPPEYLGGIYRRAI